MMYLCACFIIKINVLFNIDFFHFFLSLERLQSASEVKRKTIKLVFVASPLNMQNYGERTNWFARNQDNTSECSYADHCFSETSTIKSN